MSLIAEAATTVGMAMAPGGGDGVPVLEGMTDEERIEFLSDIPEHMHGKVVGMMVEAAEVQAVQKLAERWGCPERAPKTNICRDEVMTYLKTRPSVNSKRVEQFIDAYSANILEEEPMLPPDAVNPGPSVDAPDDDPEPEPDPPGKTDGLGDA